MGLLKSLFRGSASRPAPEPTSTAPGLPGWAQPLFAAPLRPEIIAGDDGRGRGHVLVWTVEDETSGGAISDQFKADAATYHQRYAASDHFERLFRSALEVTGVAVAPAPLILDLGSGSGVNSVVPCQRVFGGARIVATDLSAELLAMLAAYAHDSALGGSVVAVKMDAMGQVAAPGAFDLVTGASILHHLLRPEQGLAAAARALKPGGHAIFFEPFNGWSILRLAYERILAEAELRRDPLDPAIEAVLRAMIRDVAERSDPDTTTAWFPNLDDKWLFSRSKIAAWVQEVGFERPRFVPHGVKNDTLYQAMTMVTLRLSSGRDDLTLPDWATAILASFDAALTHDAKRELMMEGTIVLTKAA